MTIGAGPDATHIYGSIVPRGDLRNVFVHGNERPTIRGVAPATTREGVSVLAEKVAVLYRGGPDSDARLHLAVGDHPEPPGCAGDRAQPVLTQAYPYAVSLLVEASVPLLAAMNVLVEQLAVRTLAQTLTDDQRERLCKRCAADMVVPRTTKDP